MNPLEELDKKIINDIISASVADKERRKPGYEERKKFWQTMAYSALLKGTAARKREQKLKAKRDALAALGIEKKS